MENAAEGERQYWLNLAKVFQSRLGELANDEDTPPAAIVSASKEVFDRAYGKVTENINLKAELQILMDV